jgi:hypothetical protein
MRVPNKSVTRRQWIWLFALVAASIASTPGKARASIWLVSDGSQTGQADISLGSDTITVVLTNLLSAANFRSSSQALSDLYFTLSNNVSVTSATVSASGTAVNIDDKGNTTSAPGTTNRWSISGSSGNYLLTTLSGKQPSYLIAPSGSSYPDVNKGVKNFNPYFQGSATFTISNVGGLTSDTTVTDASLSFGTDGTEIPSTPVPAPPSVIIAMTGVGLVGGMGLALSHCRRRAVRAA